MTSNSSFNYFQNPYFNGHLSDITAPGSQQQSHTSSFPNSQQWNYDDSTIYSTPPLFSPPFYSQKGTTTPYSALTGALQATTHSSYPESSQRTNAPSAPVPPTGPIYATTSHHQFQRDPPIPPHHSTNHHQLPRQTNQPPLVRSDDAVGRPGVDSRMNVDEDRLTFKHRRMPEKALPPTELSDTMSTEQPMIRVFHMNPYTCPDAVLPQFTSGPLRPVTATLQLSPNSLDFIDDQRAQGSSRNYDSDGLSEDGGIHRQLPERQQSRVAAGAGMNGAVDTGEHMATDCQLSYGAILPSTTASEPAYYASSPDTSPPSSPRRRQRDDEMSATNETTTTGNPPKKVKMHECHICNKRFPRPSGLATHMNSHSGARPFACPLESCSKTFAVRSNARRHLRTHGITPPSGSRHGSRASPPFEVFFDTPVVAPSPPCSSKERCREPGRQKSRRVPASLASCTNAARLRSLSPGSDMADLDADDDGDGSADEEWAGRGRQPGVGCEYKYHYYRPPVSAKTVPVPLPPAVPSDPSANVNEKFEERNSYTEAGTFPYHPEQWRRFPGPALALPLKT